MTDKERNQFEENETGFNQESNGAENQPNEGQNFFDNQVPAQQNHNLYQNENIPFEPNGKKMNGNGKYFALGIVSMILGIVSITCCCLFGAPIVLAITALVFAILRMSVSPDGFSIAGLVTGIIGLIFNALMLVFVFSGEAEIDIEGIESMLESIDDAIRVFIIK